MAATAPQPDRGPRAVVVFTWDGPVTVQRLAGTDPNPSAEELAQLAADWSSRAGGVLPVVRIIEAMPSLRARGVGASGGPAGTVPRR
jgi:hypothetical protein